MANNKQAIVNSRKDWGGIPLIVAGGILKIAPIINEIAATTIKTIDKTFILFSHPLSGIKLYLITNIELYRCQFVSSFSLTSSVTSASKSDSSIKDLINTFGFFDRSNVLIGRTFWR